MTYAPAFCDSCGAPATRPGGDAGTGPYSIKHQPLCPADPTAGAPSATWTPETIAAFEADLPPRGHGDATLAAARRNIARSARRLTRPPSPETERWHDALSDIGAV